MTRITTSSASSRSTQSAAGDGEEEENDATPRKRGKSTRGSLASSASSFGQLASRTTQVATALADGIGKEFVSGDSYRPNVSSHFISGDDEENDIREELFGAHEGVPHMKSRLYLYQLMRTPSVEIVMAAVVFGDFLLIWLNTDTEAKGEASSLAVQITMHVFLGVFILDFLAALFISRWRIFETAAQRLNILLILASLVENIIGAVADSKSDALNSTRVLRIFRVFRMVRILQKIAKVKELRRLLQMASNCGKCLGWSFLFCFCVIVMWAVAAVELIHPVVIELSQNGKWPDCVDCQEAFSSVSVAALTFFKTTVAGDSWGLMAVPVIKHSPGLAIIFVGASLSIVYGILTFSNAVVVDTFAEQRMRNEKVLAEEMEWDQKEDIEFWNKIFQKLDEDQSGSVDFDELIAGARNIPAFRSRLRVLDIDEADLRQLFAMLDSDGGGTIELDEFVSALTRWRVESRTAARFVKYNLTRVQMQQETMMETFGQVYNVLQNIERRSYLGSETTDDQMFMTRTEESGTSKDDGSDVTSSAANDAQDLLRQISNICSDIQEQKLKSASREFTDVEEQLSDLSRSITQMLQHALEESPAIREIRRHLGSSPYAGSGLALQRHEIDQKTDACLKATACSVEHQGIGPIMQVKMPSLRMPPLEVDGKVPAHPKPGQQDVTKPVWDEPGPSPELMEAVNDETSKQPSHKEPEQTEQPEQASRAPQADQGPPSEKTKVAKKQPMQHMQASHALSDESRKQPGHQEPQQTEQAEMAMELLDSASESDDDGIRSVEL